VQVRVGWPFEQSAHCSLGRICDNTDILDMSAGGGAYTLKVGQTFIDRATGVTINPTSEDDNSLQVTVAKTNVPMLGDFDNDGTSDILWQSPSTSQGAIWFMKLGALSEMSLLILAPGWFLRVSATSAATARRTSSDQPGVESRRDLVWDGPAISSAAFFSLSSTVMIAAIGDFNGDGRADGSVAERQRPDRSLN
jgi:hypothetical protein